MSRSPSTGQVLAALIAGGIMPILDTTLVALAIHTLVTSLDTTVDTIQWVSTGYLLALAVTIPFVARVQRRLGGRRTWIAALVIFTVGSALCACAWNAGSLIAFRLLQGIGGGFLLPLLQTLAMQNVSPEARTRAMATVSMPIALGPVLGPVLAGIILNWMSWRWLFLINVPVGIVGILLAVMFLPDDRQTGPAASRRKLDVTGTVLLVPGLAALLYGLSGAHAPGSFGRPDVLVPLLAGIVLLAGFVWWTLRDNAAEPLMDLRLLVHRSLRTSTAALTFFGAVLFAGNFLLPLWFQEIRGADTLDAALLLIPQGIGTFAVRFGVAGLVERYGIRAVTVAGSLLMAVATVPFIVADAGTSLWIAGLALLLRGAGNGLVLVPVMSGAYGGLGRDEMPHASALTRIGQQLGGAFGTAVTATVLVAAGGAGGASGFRTAFIVLTAVTVATAAVCLREPGREPASVPA
jgi:EmrB/QacA subfamily drug resistance transporter